MTEHNAYREARSSSLYWIRTSTEELGTLEKLEDILPTFVRRRYRFICISRHQPKGGEAYGRMEIVPAETVKNDVEAADALHADVTKLFDFLLTKTTNPSLTKTNLPVRKLDHIGRISYDFIVTGIPGFLAGLDVKVSGLPAGSACHITKTSKGVREVEDFEYKMKCDDEQPGEELEAKSEIELMGEPGTGKTTGIVS